MKENQETTESELKQSYQKPQLKTFGHAVDLTQGPIAFNQTDNSVLGSA